MRSRIFEILFGAEHTLLVLLTADTLYGCGNVYLLARFLLLHCLLVPRAVDLKLLHDGVGHSHAIDSVDRVAIGVLLQIDEAKLLTSLGILNSLLFELKGCPNAEFCVLNLLSIDFQLMLPLRLFELCKSLKALRARLSKLFLEESLTQVRVSLKVYWVHGRTQRLPVELFDSLHSLEVVL